jgi:hypothetical protein
MTREFICRDCGIAVTSIGDASGHLFLMGKEREAANEQDLCLECLWLRSIEDPVEREELRQFLARRDAP